MHFYCLGTQTFSPATIEINDRTLIDFSTGGLVPGIKQITQKETEWLHSFILSCLRNCKAKASVYNVTAEATSEILFEYTGG